MPSKTTSKRKPRTGKRNVTPRVVVKPRPVKRNTTPLEADDQALLFEWAEWAACEYPELALMYHVPNESRRTLRAGYQLVRQGMKRGVPDICLPVPRGGYGALYIELKRKQGGRVSEEQRGWIDALNRAGNKAVVCRGFDEAKAAIEEYIKLR